MNARNLDWFERQELKITQIMILLLKKKTGPEGPA